MRGLRAPARLRRTAGLLAALGLLWPSPAAAQQLLDRVVARVNGTAILHTDVEAAMALGVVDAEGPDRLAAATRQMIDRRLLLAEVGRFPPPEPSEAAIGSLVAAMQARAGGGFESLSRRTGLDEEGLRELARDTLRIQAYVDQRFGTTAQVSQQEARVYYDEHPQEFTRDGVRRPFEEVEAEARQSASAERRHRLVAQWLADLHMRGDVVEVTSRP